MAKLTQKTVLKKSESLVEVIMAIFIVAMGSAVATSLIIAALQSNAFSRDNLIALNLAVEGIEAMREIRDANWLRFSYDKTGCWNMRPEVTDCQSVSAEPIAEADGATSGYTVDLDLTPNLYSWSIPDPGITPKLDLSTAGDDEAYRLFYYDIDTAVNSDGDGDADDDHDLLATPGIDVPISAAQTDASRFYRMVTVDYPLDDPVTDQEMDVISTVQWTSQSVKHQVVLTTKLTNYQKVKVN